MPIALPHAAVEAGLAPHRVRVVVLTGATGQLDDESLADMSPEIAASWREELYDAPAARVQCDLELREMCDATDVAEVWLSLMAHMTPPELDFVRARGAALTDDTREAGRQGGDGWWRDNQASGQPWPFDPSLIRAPIYLFHGDRDRWAPLAQVRRAIAGTNVQETVYAGDHLSPWTTRERRVAMLHATQSAVTE